MQEGRPWFSNNQASLGLTQDYLACGTDRQKGGQTDEIEGKALRKLRVWSFADSNFQLHWAPPQHEGHWATAGEQAEGRLRVGASG